MEAKGFGSPGERSWARPSPFGWREVVLICIGVVVGAAAVSAAVVAGTWRFILG
jgi:energy-coupling factor transport system permease protein